MNFLWFTGGLLETESPEKRYSYLLMASQGFEEIPADLQFPADGRPTLIPAEGEPTGEELASLNILLGRYLTGHVQLRAAFEQRQREAEAAEAERVAHPPEKKNLILRYWRTDEAGIRTAREGGAR